MIEEDLPGEYLETGSGPPVTNRIACSDFVCGFDPGGGDEFEIGIPALPEALGNVQCFPLLFFAIFSQLMCIFFAGAQDFDELAILFYLVEKFDFSLSTSRR